MSFQTSFGRSGFVAVFAATIITTAACGTQTGTAVEDSAPTAPGAIPAAPHSSADAEERKGAAAEKMPPTPPPPSSPPAPAGKRVPD